MSTRREDNVGGPHATQEDDVEYDDSLYGEGYEQPVENVWDTNAAFEQLAEEAIAVNSGSRTKGRRTQLTAAQIEEIQKLRLAGTAVNKIAKAYHIGPARVHQICGGAPSRSPQPAAETPTLPPARVRASSRFIAVEPPQPVMGDMGAIVSAKRGKQKKKAKAPAPIAEEDEDEPATRDYESEEESVIEAQLDELERLMDAFNAGVDDPTVVKGASALVDSLRRQGALSVLESRKMKRQLSKPRHVKPRAAASAGAAPPAAAAPSTNAPPSARDRLLAQLGGA